MLNLKTGRGIALALVCLCILGVMPIITNSRPAEFSALSFALFLSIWQVLFGLPLFLWEFRSGSGGIFSLRNEERRTVRTITVTLILKERFNIVRPDCYSGFSHRQVFKNLQRVQYETLP